MKETIQVEKEVYEAVLRNSVKVVDLEAENMQLRQFCEEFNALNVAKENQKLKSLLKKCRACVTRQIYGGPTRQYWEGVFDDKLLTKIDEVLKND